MGCAVRVHALPERSRLRLRASRAAGPAPPAILWGLDPLPAPGCRIAPPGATAGFSFWRLP